MCNFTQYSLALSLLMAGGAYANEFKSSLTVVTSGNVEGSGTDSNIYVRLYGPGGVSPRLRLQDFADPNGPTDILENGTSQTFNLGVDVGPVVTRIEVESDGKHPGSDWHLDRVIATTTNVDLANKNVADLSQALAKQNWEKANEVVARSQVKSTFIYENWLKGDETHENVDDPTKRDNGILMTRKEPIAREVGSPVTAPMTIVVISSANALGSKTEASRKLEMSTTSSKSLTLSEGTSNSVGLGAEATYSYEAGDGGGAGFSATLSAEYNYVKDSLKEESSSVETSVSTDDSFTAQPGSIQFRIGRSEGIVAKQTFESLVQDKTFTGRYVQQASPFNWTEITLTAGEPEDDKWNLDVAPDYAAAVGKPAYDRLVKLLLRYNAVTNPMTFEQVMAR